jgi:serine/threonine protein kinase
LSNSESNLSLRLDDSQQVWDLIAQQVEALIETWESGTTSPRLSDYVPKAHDAVRRLTLAELIKVDLEYRWSRRDQGTRAMLIEDYVRDFPELTEGGIPCDLLYEEYHVRQRFGDEVTADDYQRRFPDQASQLKRLLGVTASPRTMSLFAASSPPEDIEAGESLDDFDLLTRLGKGAFGIVFLARQQSMQRLVALKVSANHSNESQTLAQMDHPHIVRVYDERILADRNLRLLYMQYIPGGTLGEALDLVRQVPPSERDGKTLLAAVDRELDKRGESPPTSSSSRVTLATADWSQAICWLGIRLGSALEHAHQLGVLHRDIKPANVMLNAEAEPKLVDFNISFCSKQDGASPAAYFGGSLAYMSPEQLQAFHPGNPLQPESLDGRSDIYSLGMVLWELLTGERPFREEHLRGDWAATLDTMIERRLAGIDQTTIDRVPAGYPPELTEVLRRCLAPQPDDRYASGEELAGELRLCLRPETRNLLRAPSVGWRSLVRRHALLVLLLMTLLPNAVAALFNIAYNQQYIVDRLQDSQAAFWATLQAFNAVAFPLGLGLGAVLIWPVSRALGQMRRGEPPPTDRMPALRRRTLKLGHYAALIGIVEWMLAGIVYPVSIRAAGVDLLPGDYFHFMGSMALCGLIAAIYPFFCMTFVCVRAVYPVLYGSRSASVDDASLLYWLHRMTWFYLALAAALPMLGVVLLVSIGGDHGRWTLGILSAGGLMGFGVAVWLARAIQNDLATLAHVVNPTDDSALVGSIIFDSTRD